MGWTLVERANLYMTKDKRSSLHMGNLENSVIGSHGERCLQLSDLRIPLIFVSCFEFMLSVADIFGISFEIELVGCFVLSFPT